MVWSLFRCFESVCLLLVGFLALAHLLDQASLHLHRSRDWLDGRLGFLRLVLERLEEVFVAGLRNGVVVGVGWVHGERNLLRMRQRVDFGLDLVADLQLFVLFESEPGARQRLLEKAAFERSSFEVPALQPRQRLEELFLVLFVGEHVAEALADLLEEEVLERLQGVPYVFLEGEERQRVDAVVADVEPVQIAQFVFLDLIAADVQRLVRRAYRELAVAFEEVRVEHFDVVFAEV